MPAFHLAQFNLARAVAPLDDPVMAGFMNRLDELNALAERSPGFVWRLQGDNGNATDLKYTDDRQLIVNLSVWATADDLFDFTYRSNHKGMFARRRDWFERLPPPSLVLWWLPAERLPTAEEGFARLQRVADHGPTPDAFTFKHRFPPPG